MKAPAIRPPRGLGYPIGARPARHSPPAPDLRWWPCAGPAPSEPGPPRLASPAAVAGQRPALRGTRARAVGLFGELVPVRSRPARHGRYRGRRVHRTLPEAAQPGLARGRARPGSGAWPWAHRPIPSITRRDVIELLDSHRRSRRPTWRTGCSPMCASCSAGRWTGTS